MPYISPNSSTLYYEEKGKGPCVLFLHGLGGTHTLWQRPQDVLKEHFRVITIDLPGHGKSSPMQKPYTIKDIANTLSLFLDALGITSCHLVGASFGGFIALEFAVLHPHFVQTLTLVATTHMIKKGHLLSILFRKFLLLFPMKIIAKVIAKRLLAKKELLRKKVEEVLAANNKAQYMLAMHATCRFGVEDDQLKKLLFPILIIHGEDDTNIPVKAAYSLTEKLPNAKIEVIKGAAHLPELETPKVFIALLSDFLQANTASCF